MPVPQRVPFVWPTDLWGLYLFTDRFDFCGFTRDEWQAWWDISDDTIRRAGAQGCGGGQGQNLAAAAAGPYAGGPNVHGLR